MAAGEYGPLIALSLIYTAQSPGHNEVYHVHKDNMVAKRPTGYFYGHLGFFVAADTRGSRTTLEIQYYFSCRHVISPL